MPTTPKPPCRAKGAEKGRVDNSARRVAKGTPRGSCSSVPDDDDDDDDDDDHDHDEPFSKCVRRKRGHGSPPPAKRKRGRRPRKNSQQIPAAAAVEERTGGRPKNPSPVADVMTREKPEELVAGWAVPPPRRYRVPSAAAAPPAEREDEQPPLSSAALSAPFDGELEIRAAEEAPVGDGDQQQQQHLGSTSSGEIAAPPCTVNVGGDRNVADSAVARARGDLYKLPHRRCGLCHAPLESGGSATARGVEILRCRHLLCPECACKALAQPRPPVGGGAWAAWCPLPFCGRRVERHVYHRADGTSGEPVDHSCRRREAGAAGGSDEARWGAEEDDNGTPEHDERRTDNRVYIPLAEPLDVAHARDRNQTNWLGKYDRLQAYKREYGDFMVPPSTHSKLNGWVKRQRVLYRQGMNEMEESGSCSGLTADTTERLKLLDEIGFYESLDLSSPYFKDVEHHPQPGSGGPARTKKDVRWWEQFDALKRFQFQHGHIRVPKKYPPNPSLWVWTEMQRGHYRALQDKDSRNRSNLTKDRLSALESIGFVFVVVDDPDRLWAQWNDQLKKYKAQKGDCLVPFLYKENPGLGLWVGGQRKHYQNKTEGKKTPLTEERIELLNEIGFVWRLRRKRNSVNQKIRR